MKIYITQSESIEPLPFSLGLINVPSCTDFDMQEDQTDSLIGRIRLKIPVPRIYSSETMTYDIRQIILHVNIDSRFDTTSNN